MVGFFMSKKKTTRSTQEQSTLIGDAYDAFVVARQAQNVTRQTLTYYAYQLRPFIADCEQSNVATVDLVTAATVRAYLVSLQRRGLAPYTVHGAARAIRAFLRFCAEDGLIDAAPVFSMPKLPKKILPAFEAPDVARMLDACLTTTETN